MPLPPDNPKRSELKEKDRRIPSSVEGGKKQANQNEKKKDFKFEPVKTEIKSQKPNKITVKVKAKAKKAV